MARMTQQTLSYLFYLAFIVFTLFALTEALLAGKFPGIKVDLGGEMGHVVKETGSYLEAGFIRNNHLLGYSPSENRKVTHLKQIDDDLLFNVSYSIDEMGRRWVSNKGSSDKEWCFFGGSYTFGYGLDDDQTLPWQMKELLDHETDVWNYGFSGYGPQQMLRQIDIKLISKHENHKRIVAVYQFGMEHVERSLGRFPYLLWGGSGPIYRYDSSGKLAFAGSLFPRPIALGLKVINQSLLGRLIIRSMFDGRRTKADLIQFVDHLALAQEEIKGQLNGVFFAFVWKPDQNSEESDYQFLIKRMQEKNILFGSSEEIDVRFHEANGPFRIHQDGHPSELGNKKIAEYLLNNLSEAA